jgi:hypothetical protein
MPELRPTRTRLALLRAVADGAVTAHNNSPARGWKTTWSQVDLVGAGWPMAGAARWRTVTAAVRELEDAGWVRAGPRLGSYYAPRPWEITDMGKAVLLEVSDA